MNAILRFFFPEATAIPEGHRFTPNLTPEMIKKRDALLALLERVSTATSIRVDEDRNVFVHWSDDSRLSSRHVSLILFPTNAVVTVKEPSTTTSFTVLYENCLPAQTTREDLYRKAMLDVCEKALQFTERS